jgi:hypothetical protein
MLSDVGKKLFFPKGILSQSAEAREKAHASMRPSVLPKKAADHAFDSVMASINNIRPSRH